MGIKWSEKEGKGRGKEVKGRVKEFYEENRKGEVRRLDAEM